MNYLSDTEADALLKEAKLACETTYSPYSSFPVGAALLAKEGRIFKGANVENASYGLTICAERVAVGSAIAAGLTEFTAIAVYTSAGGAAPCGACRQFLIEFGKDIVVIFSDGNETVQKTVGQLLPFAFTREALGK